MRTLGQVGVRLGLAIALVCSSAPALAGRGGADFTVLDQNGKRVQFYRDVVADKTVVVNFIYTHCKYVCPRQGDRFRVLQGLLKDRLEKDVRLVSISLDPKADPPEQMKAWGKRFGAQKGWRLLTGKPEMVGALIASIVGGAVDKEMHSPVLMIGNARGEWRRASGMDAPQNILQQVDRVEAHPTAAR